MSEAVRIRGLNAAGTSVNVSQYKRLDNPDRREPPPVRMTAIGREGGGGVEVWGVTSPSLYIYALATKDSL